MDKKTDGGALGGGRRWIGKLFALILVILSVFALLAGGAYLSFMEYYHQTNMALERRSSIADLGAMLVHEKIQGIINVGVSLASRRMIYQAIEKSDWSEAIKALDKVSQIFPDIDSVALFDIDGFLKEVIPSMPDAVGKNFAYRDYYQGIIKDWKPYVSEVFERAVEPRYNVISIAIPIKSLEQKNIGILLLTLKLDAIVSWHKDINVGPNGLLYIVDKKGMLIAHDHLKSQGLIDYSSVETVKRLLRGERGVGVIFNNIENEERVTAYSPVKDFGFGVVVAQAVSSAFAERDRNVMSIIVLCLIIICIVGLFFYLILRDRKKIEEQLNRERILLESVGDGVVVIDRDWRITLWNEAASRITGYNKAEALSQSFRSIIKFIRESDRKEDIAFIEDAIVMKRPSFMEIGSLLVKKDGSEIPIGDSAAPIIDENGDVKGAIIVFRDASKERNTMHMRSEFVYASHQLRTPITEALWTLDVAKNETDSAKRAEDLRIIEGSLMSVQKLSDHLVSASEIDQGSISVKKVPVKIVDIFNGIQDDFSKKAKECNVALSFGPISLLAAINTDQIIFGKALQEVVENAISYSSSGAKVLINAVIKDKDLIVEVVDSGVGIPEAEQPIIFTKFFRASNRLRKVAGAGLGLYIARGYIKALGGKIWFKSEENKGTTFFISIPIE